MPPSSSTHLRRNCLVLRAAVCRRSAGLFRQGLVTALSYLWFDCFANISPRCDAARRFTSIGDDYADSFKNPSSRCTRLGSAISLPALAFDLTHSLTSHLENPPAFFERVAVAIDQSESQANDLTLTECQRLQQLFRSCHATCVACTADRVVAVTASMNSPKLLSSPSPTGRSKLTG